MFNVHHILTDQAPEKQHQKLGSMQISIPMTDGGIASSDPTSNLLPISISLSAHCIICSIYQPPAQFNQKLIASTCQLHRIFVSRYPIHTVKLPTITILYSSMEYLRRLDGWRRASSSSMASVPNNRSPASPKPGRTWPCSSSLSSTVPTLTQMSGWASTSFLRPSRLAMTLKT